MKARFGGLRPFDLDGHQKQYETNLYSVMLIRRFVRDHCWTGELEITIYNQ